jgi:hypothetical protein
LQHPAGAIQLPLLECKKLTLNMLHKSDIVPALVLTHPKAGGDDHVSSLNASGVENVPPLSTSGFENVSKHQEAA